MELCNNEAIDEDTPVTVTWIERGQPVVGDLELIDFHGDTIHAYNLDEDGEEVYVPMSAIISLQPDPSLYDEE